VQAAGKARSIDGGVGAVLGVDTIVVCEGEAIGKPADALTYYRRVFAVDIEFRDIGDRLTAMERMAQ
jgi:hypothetical protein